MTALREINVLLQLRHENIVDVREMVREILRRYCGDIAGGILPRYC